MLAKDRYLLNTGTFQYIFLVWELTTCLLNTVACIIEVATKKGFTVITLNKENSVQSIKMRNCIFDSKKNFKTFVLQALLKLAIIDVVTSLHRF